NGDAGLSSSHHSPHLVAGQPAGAHASDAAVSGGAVFRGGALFSGDALLPWHFNGDAVTHAVLEDLPVLQITHLLIGFFRAFARPVRAPKEALLTAQLKLH